MLFYILSLSRLGSIRRGLACYSISCHALAVSAEAWHAILISYHALAVSAEAWHPVLYLFTPWQYLPRLSILFYIFSCLGSICKGLAITAAAGFALQQNATLDTQQNGWNTAGSL